MSNLGAVQAGRNPYPRRAWEAMRRPEQHPAFGWL